LRNKQLFTSDISVVLTFQELSIHLGLLLGVKSSCSRFLKRLFKIIAPLIAGVQQLLSGLKVSAHLIHFQPQGSQVACVAPQRLNLSLKRHYKISQVFSLLLSRNRYIWGDRLAYSRP
jgi:hypothetical protein